jgi:hypothetical protein
VPRCGKSCFRTGWLCPTRLQSCWACFLSVIVHNDPLRIQDRPRDHPTCSKRRSSLFRASVSSSALLTLHATHGIIVVSCPGSRWHQCITRCSCLTAQPPPATGPSEKLFEQRTIQLTNLFFSDNIICYIIRCCCPHNQPINTCDPTTASKYLADNSKSLNGRRVQVACLSSNPIQDRIRFRQSQNSALSRPTLPRAGISAPETRTIEVEARLDPEMIRSQNAPPNRTAASTENSRSPAHAATQPPRI